ncbi:ribonuclease-3 [Arcanobacterium pluranimalium]|uniref:ribonuclease III n=1 Tax=Arcanobacterium pluranimalium TaxID=108028 RepID=UPI00195EB61E|nr:ribonuclease III [Arcanobacterium pluranimalium]MBM7825221.1 ribonuclease-3 [Arcanobacterium pluranimalium]
MHKKDRIPLLEKWGVSIDPQLLELALTHRSWAFEHESLHNERLEFLGDSVLGFFAADRIFQDFDDSTEGDMSKIKSAAVSERALAEVARELGVGDYIRLGIGEERSGGRNKDSILSDTVEALIAATYLDHGIDVTREIVERHINPKIADATKMGPALDWRTAVEEKARALGIREEISYRIEGRGPDHAREYTAFVYFGEDLWGSGEATSQKNAKLAACQNAYFVLDGGEPLGHA